jgi:hypothetical protein
MIWPFPKADDSVPAVATQMYECMFKLLNDEAEQIDQYPEPLKSEMINGSDCDENAGGFGSFGTLTNPIPVNGPIGEILYLSALRLGGNRLLFHRLTSIDKVDVFECVGIDGKHWDLLYLDMYHPRKSKRTPKGYAIADDNVLLSGIAYEVADFPHSLYSGIVSYSETRFGISIADPMVRIAVERNSFVRPPSHSEILQEYSGDYRETTKLAFVNQFASETIDAQKQIYEILMKFNQWTKDGKSQLPLENIRFDEIVFFPLAAAIHSLLSWFSGDATSLADDICKSVLRTNVDEGGLTMTMWEAVELFRGRFAVYKRILLSVENDQFSFGLQLSQAFLGKENPLIGAALAGISTIILKIMKDIILEQNAFAPNETQALGKT